MYRLNRTARILLAVLLGTLLDSGLAIAASGADPLRAGARAIAAVASLRQAEAIEGGVDSDGDGVADMSAATASAAGASASSCGGPYERACCLGENLAIGTCRADLLTVAGCTGDCRCGGLGLADASHTCYPRTCGARGQRACTVLERPFQPCDGGLQEIPGCSGDCFGSGFSQWSSSMCGDMSEQIAEPTTNRESIAQPDSCAVS